MLLDGLKRIDLSFALLYFFLFPFLLISQAEKEISSTHTYSDCKFHSLKIKDKLDCVVEEFAGNEMILYVYELENQTLKGIPQKIIIPSWYNFADVEYRDILGEGKKMIFATFEGNSGLATLQKILIVFHFQNNAFRPVLFETVSYRLSCCGKSQSLDLKYKFVDSGSKRVSIQLNYTYNQYVAEKVQLDKKKIWADELVWDNKNLTFYDADQETKKNKKAEFYVEKKIYQTRLDFPPIHTIEMQKLTDLIYKSKIFEVLINEKS
ncbi:MAG: hypothetical protein KA146_00530 [Leptospiraceae bacterium]|nr:hypothetical protein [Leptospiraceae bacterium]